MMLGNAGIFLGKSEELLGIPYKLVRDIPGSFLSPQSFSKV